MLSLEDVPTLKRGSSLAKAGPFGYDVQGLRLERVFCATAPNVLCVEGSSMGVLRSSIVSSRIENELLHVMKSASGDYLEATPLAHLFVQSSYVGTCF